MQPLYVCLFYKSAGFILLLIVLANLYFFCHLYKEYTLPLFGMAGECSPLLKGHAGLRLLKLLVANDERWWQCS